MVGALLTRVVHGTVLDDALSSSFYAITFLYLAAHHDRELTQTYVGSAIR